MAYFLFLFVVGGGGGGVVFVAVVVILSRLCFVARQHVLVAVGLTR